MALAQKELSLIQKGLLAKKLAGPDLPLPKAEELCVSARLRPGRPNQLDFQQVAEELCRSARLRPGRPNQSEFLRKADKAGSSLPKVGLYDLARTIDLPLLKAEEPCVSARLRLGRPD